MSPPSWVWAKFLSKINIWATKNMPVCGSVAFVSASVSVCVCACCVFRGAKEIWKYLESTNCRIMWSSLQTFLLLYICVTLSPPSARIVVVSRGRPLSLFAWVSCRRRRCRIVSVCVAQNCCFSDDCLLLLFLLARPAGALWYQNAKNKPNLNYNFFLLQVFFFNELLVAFDLRLIPFNCQKNLETITCVGDAVGAAINAAVVRRSVATRPLFSSD